MNTAISGTVDRSYAAGKDVFHDTIERIVKGIKAGKSLAGKTLGLVGIVSAPAFIAGSATAGALGLLTGNKRKVTEYRICQGTVSHNQDGTEVTDRSSHFTQRQLYRDGIAVSYENVEKVLSSPRNKSNPRIFEAKEAYKLGDRFSKKKYEIETCCSRRNRFGLDDPFLAHECAKYGEIFQKRISGLNGHPYSHPIKSSGPDDGSRGSN